MSNSGPALEIKMPPKVDEKPASIEHVSATLSFVTSGIGGMAGWAVVHPFNTIAVRSNLASTMGKTFSLKTMLAEHGWMSLYDGLAAGLTRQVSYASARFGLFEIFRDKLHDYRGHTDFAARCV